MTEIAHLYICYLVLQKLASVFLKCNNFVTKSSFFAFLAFYSMNLSWEGYSVPFKTWLQTDRKIARFFPKKRFTPALNCVTIKPHYSYRIYHLKEDAVNGI